MADFASMASNSGEAPLNYNTFWQAGLYKSSIKAERFDGLQTARVHPKFLHSNATSHEWPFGAIAELLDNAVDEIPNGCTRVHVDVEEDSSGQKMLTVKDNGGGMDRHHLHRMMSFGMSDGKDRGDRIGQYGNGFKTSSMRLGGSALVVTKRRKGQRSVGLLSFNFLRDTGAEDVIVPIVSWDKKGAPLDDGRGREESLRIIGQWSPYGSEEELLGLFELLGKQGTLVIIYNLWQSPDGGAELDMESDKRDIQLPKSGAATNNKRHRNYESHQQVEVKYRGWLHSLRHYCAILYRELPEDFTIVLRNKRVPPRALTASLRHAEVHNYNPQLPRIPGKDFAGTYPITLGFVEEAPNAPIMGINVYHRNRLILCMWEPYNSPSSKGRGVLGQLEVDFVAPTHSKQKFENTELFQRLEAKLKALIPAYWTKHAHLVGYQVNKPADREPPPPAVPAAPVHPPPSSPDLPPPPPPPPPPVAHRRLSSEDAPPSPPPAPSGAHRRSSGPVEGWGEGREVAERGSDSEGEREEDSGRSAERRQYLAERAAERERERAERAREAAEQTWVRQELVKKVRELELRLKEEQARRHRAELRADRLHRQLLRLQPSADPERDEERERESKRVCIKIDSDDEIL